MGLRNCRGCNELFKSNTSGKLCAACRYPKCVVCALRFEVVGLRDARRSKGFCSLACREKWLHEQKIAAAGDREHPHGAKWIPLTRGMWALVDEDDFATLSKHSWHAVISRRGLVYARRREGDKRISMHRSLIPIECDEIDHINGDTLDNRRSNLRPATHAENMRNSARKSNSTYRYKGVYKSGTDWWIRITVDGKQVSIGRFASEGEAARAYDATASDLYGEFARLNFPGAA